MNECFKKQLEKWSQVPDAFWERKKRKKIFDAQVMKSINLYLLTDVCCRAVYHGISEVRYHITVHIVDSFMVFFVYLSSNIVKSYKWLK